MGCMACVGENKPAKASVRCFRIDALVQKSSLGRPIASLPPVAQRTGFKAWATDERLGTFVLSRGEDAPSRNSIFEIGSFDAQQEPTLPDGRQVSKMSCHCK